MVLVVLIVVASCVPLVLLLVRNTPPWRGDILLHPINYRDFDLSGVVVDQDGAAVRDVDMYVHRTWMSMTLESESDSRVVRVNGAFHVRLPNCAVATLRFEDPRYYPDRREFTQPGTHSNLRIVLQKLGKRTQPANYRCFLRFSIDNSGTVLDFAMQPARSVNHRTRPDVTRSVSDLSNPDLLPKSAMYMLSDLTPDGRLDTMEYRKAPPSTGHPPVPYPKRLVLVNTDPQGGFIRFTPQPDRRTEYQMFKAPATGYEPRLVLGTADLGRPTHAGQGHTWFYFKIAGKYGRGNIGSATVSKDGRTVELEVTLLLQPDGTDNLEFYDH